MEGEGAMEADRRGKTRGRRGAVRYGRPPRGHAGQVEERILDAAGRVFLEHGFQGASVDEIAEAASAGKPTIYARFPNKQALFTAVVERLVRRNTSHLRPVLRRRLDRGAARRPRRHNPDPDSGPGNHRIDQGRGRRSAALSRSRDKRQLHGAPTPDRSGGRACLANWPRPTRSALRPHSRRTGSWRRRAGFSTSWCCRC